MYWRDLSPHARELVIRMVLTQPPTYFRHVENEDPESWQMSFVIDEEYGVEAAGAFQTLWSLPVLSRCRGQQE